MFALKKCLVRKNKQGRHTPSEQSQSMTARERGHTGRHNMVINIQQKAHCYSGGSLRKKYSKRKTRLMRVITNRKEMPQHTKIVTVQSFLRTEDMEAMEH